jgi:epsilon-lactone hydrolase
MKAIPSTISDQAKNLIEAIPNPNNTPSLPDPDAQVIWDIIHAANEEKSKANNESITRIYAPSIEELNLGGVPVLSVTPKNWHDNGKVIVYIHGGGYTFFSAYTTLTSCVPVADDTGTRIISIDYTLAPKAQWQEILDQCLTVVCMLKEKGYDFSDIAIYGDSAGGALAAAVALKMRDDGYGLPSAIVLWSPWSDITQTGDSHITLADADPCYRHQEHLLPCAKAYAPVEDHKHPYVSPVYADYSSGFPPTLIQGGTREVFLSHFVRHYQALDQADIEVKLDLYEGMVHAFQAFGPLLPETKIARSKMVEFLNKVWAD